MTNPAVNEAVNSRAVTESDGTVRPTCPTCGGTRTVDIHYITMPFGRECPDCVDGKVSIEQLVAVYNAELDVVDERWLDEPQRDADWHYAVEEEEAD